LDRKIAALPTRHPPPAKPAKPLLVGIVGGSGAGKSWLADQLAAALGAAAARLSLDDFYRDRSHLAPSRRTRVNFDHPRAIDWPCLERVLDDLEAGRRARAPRYDFATHCRLREWRELDPKPVLLMDGLWLLHRRSLRRRFALTLFLECESETRLRRRLDRDLASRGRTRESIIDQFRRVVEPMHRRFVAPQGKRAGLVLGESVGAREVLELRNRILKLLSIA
jgi:uridine kinase